MENTTQVLIIMLIALAGIGVVFVYLLCRMINIGSSERKAMKTSKKFDDDTEAKGD